MTEAFREQNRENMNVLGLAAYNRQYNIPATYACNKIAIQLHSMCYWQTTAPATGIWLPLGEGGGDPK